MSLERVKFLVARNPSTQRLAFRLAKDEEMGQAISMTAEEYGFKIDSSNLGGGGMGDGCEEKSVE